MRINFNTGWPWTDQMNVSAYQSKKSWPKISIVTPSYNQGQFIEETILSVLNQNYPNLEYIIIDGGSTDHTVEIIRKYADKLTYWVSEKDNGQSDAINKGLELCTGDIFNWVNSDDYLEKDSLFRIASLFDTYKYDLYCGSVINFDDRSSSQTLFKNKNIDIQSLISVNIPNPYYYHQPGVWFATEKLKQVLPFKVDFRFCFDFELTLRYVSKFHKVIYDNSVISYFRHHDDSKTILEQKKFTMEFMDAYLAFFKSLSLYHPLKFSAYRKYKSFKWHVALNQKFDEKHKLQSFLFIIGNIIKNPLTNCTRMTFGRVKQLFRYV